MKELNIKQLIYLCKNHDTDKNINIMLGLTDREIVKKIVELKQAGLYDKYKNMTQEECNRILERENLNEEASNNTNKKTDNTNSLLGLNNILFKQLNNLMDDSLSENELKQELEVSKQVVNVSQTIINNANLLLQAKKHFDTTGTKNNEVASLLRLEE